MVFLSVFLLIVLCTSILFPLSALYLCCCNHVHFPVAGPINTFWFWLKSTKWSIHLHNSLDVVFFVWPGGFLLHKAGLSVGQSVPAQVPHVRLWVMLLALGASTGAGPKAGGASARVKRVLVGYVFAQHHHPILQVTDGARRAAGGAVQTPLRWKPPLEFQHCSSAKVSLQMQLKLWKKKVFWGISTVSCAACSWLHPEVPLCSCSVSARPAPPPPRDTLRQSSERTCVLLQPAKPPVSLPPGQPFLKWV